MRFFFPGARAFGLGLVLVVVLAACGGAAGPLAVESVTLMRDEGGKPGAVVTSFKPSEHVFHARAKLNQTATGFSGKAAWVAVETSAGDGIPIATVDISGGAADTLDTQIELPNDWPTGKYKVEFYQGDKLLKAQEFTVQP